MKPSTKLTQKQLEKFVRLVKNNTQGDAIILFLGEGLEFSTLEAKLAGIADPARVIYTLRNQGVAIYCNPRKTKSGGTVMRYRLGTSKRA
jgi:hypothetical protein